MSLLNVISVPTPIGIKTIEIHNADLSRLNWEIDILVMSAYHNKYKPAPGTIIEALFVNTGLVVEELAAKPLIDLRLSLNCWLSNVIAGLPFKYILCVEGIKSSIETTGNSENAIIDLFASISILHYKNVKSSSIAMPILGAGFQGNAIEKILPILIENAINALNSNTTLNTIYFVERDESKAKLIDETINLYLHRSSDKLEFVFSDPSLVDLLKSVLFKLLQIQSNKIKFSKNKTFQNLIEKIHSKQLRFFEIGILCRKLLELLLADISDLKSDRYIPIYEHINELKTKNIAEWMIAYLHTVRIFGNFAAHEEESKNIPEHMEKSDFFVLIHALNRVLDLYITMKAIKIKNSI